MTFEQVNGIYTELCKKYEAEFQKSDAKCDSEIYCEDENLDKTENPEEAKYFSLDINVFTDNIDKDNGLCFCISVPVSNMRIDDDDILEEQRFFEETITGFIDKLSHADSVDELIKAEGEAAEQEVEKMMNELERKIKKTNTIALIAVGICVAAAVVAILFKFLL